MPTDMSHDPEKGVQEQTAKGPPSAATANPHDHEPFPTSHSAVSHSLQRPQSQPQQKINLRYAPNVSWWNYSLETIKDLTHLDDVHRGLSTSEVEQHSAILGNNIVPMQAGGRHMMLLLLS